jgi:hypothetical protein
MVIVPLGIVLWKWRRERTVDWPLAVGPLLVVGGWAAYVRLRLNVPLLEGQTQELGVPFGGFISALGKWLDSPGIDLVVALVLLAVAIVFALRLFRTPTLLAAATGGFALLAVFLTEQVWLNYFDITRAMAPLLTGFGLTIGLDRDTGPSPNDPD